MSKTPFSYFKVKYKHLLMHLCTLQKVTESEIIEVRQWISDFNSALAYYTATGLARSMAEHHRRDNAMFDESLLSYNQELDLTVSYLLELLLNNLLALHHFQSITSGLANIDNLRYTLVCSMNQSANLIVKFL